MAEKFETSKNVVSGDPETLAALKGLSGEVMSKNKSELALKAAKLKEYKTKIQSFLQVAKVIGDQKLTYRHPYVCDTFVKKIFNEIGDKSLDGIYGTYAMYNQYKEKYGDGLAGNITIANNAFTYTGKAPESGDLLFFLDAKDGCPHVGIVSSYFSNVLYIYDASNVGVGRRKVLPSEFNGNYGYTHLSYAPPFSL